jgi:hypothetical protein|tara:strand:- start:5197 stop:5394 length:198 start_codon:yes stop_codon:yes gene_type:complete
MTNEKTILTKAIEWLEEEVKYNQDIADAYENDEEAITTDGTDDINFGRYECAKGLLNQIEKWSKE